MLHADLIIRPWPTFRSRRLFRRKGIDDPVEQREQQVDAVTDQQGDGNQVLQARNIIYADCMHQQGLQP